MPPRLALPRNVRASRDLEVDAVFLPDDDVDDDDDDVANVSFDQT